MGDFNEIHDLISCYLIDRHENLEFLNSFSGNKIKAEYDKILINSCYELDNLDYINQYKSIILNYQSIQSNEKMQRKGNVAAIFSDANEWIFDIDKFDSIINVFNLNLIKDIKKFLYFSIFSLKKNGHLSFIFFSQNSFQDLIKKMISLDSRFNDNKIINRIIFPQNAQILENALRSLKFQNIAIIKESIDFKTSNLKKFLFDEKNKFLFSKEHFSHKNNIETQIDDNTEYSENIEVFLVHCNAPNNKLINY